MALVSDVDLVRNTISLASTHLDNKEFDRLKEVFTEDCTVNYPSSLGLMSGVGSVIQTLDKLLHPIDTFHALSTQIVRLTGYDTAEATTYCSASHYRDGRSFFAEGRYEDKLVKEVKEALEGVNVWKIKERTTTAMGVGQGDPTIFSTS